MSEEIESAEKCVVVSSDSASAALIIIHEAAQAMSGCASHIERNASDYKGVLTANLLRDQVKKLAWVSDVLEGKQNANQPLSLLKG